MIPIQSSLCSIGSPIRERRKSTFRVLSETYARVISSEYVTNSRPLDRLGRHATGSGLVLVALLTVTPGMRIGELDSVRVDFLS